MRIRVNKNKKETATIVTMIWMWMTEYGSRDIKSKTIRKNKRGWK